MTSFSAFRYFVLSCFSSVFLFFDFVFRISNFGFRISDLLYRYFMGVIITSRWAAPTAACNWASSNAIIEVRSTGI